MLDPKSVLAAQFFSIGGRFQGGRPLRAMLGRKRFGPMSKISVDFAFVAAKRDAFAERRRDNGEAAPPKVFASHPARQSVRQNSGGGNL